MNRDRDQIHLQSIENAHRRSAATIRKTLEKLLNRPERSKRLWIWELVQNAKDGAKTLPNVRLEIRHSESHFEFAHNADAFDNRTLGALVEQISSKDSTGRDPGVTGLHGTGFISTHLLSRVVDLKGVVLRADGRYRDF